MIQRRFPDNHDQFIQSGLSLLSRNHYHNHQLYCCYSTVAVGFSKVQSGLPLPKFQQLIYALPTNILYSLSHCVVYKSGQASTY